MFPEIHYYRIYILSVSNVLKSIQDGFLHGRKKRGIREMEYKVGVISGDGIGPEIVTEAKKVPFPAARHRMYKKTHTLPTRASKLIHASPAKMLL